MRGRIYVPRIFNCTKFGGKERGCLPCAVIVVNKINIHVVKKGQITMEEKILVKSEHYNIKPIVIILCVVFSVLCLLPIGIRYNHYSKQYHNSEDLPYCRHTTSHPVSYYPSGSTKKSITQDGQVAIHILNL